MEREVRIDVDLNRTGDDRAIEQSEKDLRALEPAASRASRGFDQLEKEVKQTAAQTRKLAGDNRKLKKQVRDVEKALSRARKELDRFKKSGKGLSRLNKSFSRLQKTLIAGFGLAKAKELFERLISTIANFEQSMANVRAVSQATDEQFARLKATAQEMGKTTVFSASEAANALEELSRAGLSVDDSIAAVPQVLNLAAAGGLDLASAADIATNVMSGFGETVDQLPRIMDVLAHTAANSNTNIELLGSSMKAVAPVSASLGISIEDTAAALGTLANSGIKGEEAGNKLKRIFANLVDATPKAQAAVEALGLSMEDLNPATNDFEDIIRRLAEAGLDAQSAFRIFGRVAGPAVSTLVKNVEGLEQFRVKLDGATGSAERMSNVMQDNLQGSLKRLQSVIEASGLALGDGGFGSALRTAVDDLANFLERSQGTFKAIGGLLGGLIKLVSLASTSISAGFRAIAGAVGLGLGQATKSLLEFGEVLARVLSNVPGLEEFGNQLRKDLEGLGDVADEFIQTTSDRAVEGLRAAKEGLGTDLEGIAELFNQTGIRVVQETQGAVEQTKQQVSAGTRDLLEYASQLGREFEDAIKINPEIDLSELKERFGQQIEDVYTSLTERGAQVDEGFKKAADALGILPRAVEANFLKINEFLAGFDLDAGTLIEDAQNFAAEFEAALEVNPKLDLDAFGDAAKSKIQKILDGLIAAGQEVDPAFQAIADKLGILPSKMEAVAERAKEILGELPGALKGSRAEIESESEALKEALSKLGGVQGVFALDPEVKAAVKEQIGEVVAEYRKFGAKIDPVIASHANNLGLLVGGWETAAAGTKEGAESITETSDQLAGSVEDASNRMVTGLVSFETAAEHAAEVLDKSALAQKDSISVVVESVGEAGELFISQQKVTKDMAQAMTLSEIEAAPPKLKKYAKAVQEAQIESLTGKKGADEIAKAMDAAGTKAEEAKGSYDGLVATQRELTDATKAATGELRDQTAQLKSVAATEIKESLAGLAAVDLSNLTTSLGQISERLPQITERAAAATRALEELSRAGQQAGGNEGGNEGVA